MQITSSEFVISNSDPRKCPAPVLPEFAFLGRSNVGKSSFINMLCSRRKLAKISSSPGKTRLINHFLINKAWYLVDLPGYGYARASKTARQQWEKMIRTYLLNRTNLMLTFILLDIRLEPQASDLEMINRFGEWELPIALIFTKRDKINQQTASENTNAFKTAMLDCWSAMPPIFVTSSKTAFGREGILAFIEESQKLFIKP